MCKFKKKRSQNLSQKKGGFFFPAEEEGRQQKNQGSRGNRRFRCMKVIGRGKVCQTRLEYEGNDAQQ